VIAYSHSVSIQELNKKSKCYLSQMSLFFVLLIKANYWQVWNALLYQMCFCANMWTGSINFLYTACNLKVTNGHIFLLFHSLTTFQTRIRQKVQTSKISNVIIFIFFSIQAVFFFFQKVSFEVIYDYAYNLFHQTYPYFLLAGRVHEDEVCGGQVEGAHGGVARAEPVQQLDILHL